MDITIPNWSTFSVDTAIINLTYLDDTQTYNAYLSIFLDAHSNITLRTEIYDPDKFVCTVTALQMCVSLFGDVCSTDVYVLDGDGEISEEFSTDAAVEIVYPHLRSSASLH